MTPPPRSRRSTARWVCPYATCRKEREEEHIFDLAGGGFESTVRLAKSLPQTWAPIFLGNKYNILDVLREHIHQLQIMRRMIERDDREGLIEMMHRANKIRNILK